MYNYLKFRRPTKVMANENYFNKLYNNSLLLNSYQRVSRYVLESKVLFKSYSITLEMLYLNCHLYIFHLPLSLSQRFRKSPMHVTSPWNLIICHTRKEVNCFSPSSSQSYNVRKHIYLFNINKYTDT